MLVFDSSFRNRSISAFCVLIVSFNSERAEDDSCLLMMLLLRSSCVEDGGDVFLMNASCDVDSGLLGMADAVGIIAFLVRSNAAKRETINNFLVQLTNRNDFVSLSRHMCLLDDWMTFHVSI